MKIFDLFSMGFRNLFRRKARTLLTVVGVVIGTISIVVMISVGIGMNRSFEASILENGSMTMINVMANNWTEGEGGEWTNKKQKLDDELLEKLKNIDHVRAVSPLIDFWDFNLYVGDYYSFCGLTVMDMAAYEDFGYPPMDDGSYPTKEEAAKTIYIGHDAIGQFHYWDGRASRSKDVVLGRDKIEFKFLDGQANLRKKQFKYQIKDYKMIKASESGYSETDYNMFMDIELFKELRTKYANTLKIDDRRRVLSDLTNYSNILINADNMNNVTAIQEEIEKLGFSSMSDMQYIEPLKETADMLELVLGAIGAVAMLVSAINIANTMIMSIYERTREIGIMKVLGCKVGTVRTLFLFEAAMIGLMGGTIGIGLSYVASWALNTYGGQIFESLMSTSVGTGGGAFSVIPFWLPFFGAGFAVLIGLISGFVPAVRATKISAIEAMKTAE